MMDLGSALVWASIATLAAEGLEPLPAPASIDEPLCLTIARIADAYPEAGPIAGVALEAWAVLCDWPVGAEDRTP